MVEGGRVGDDDRVVHVEVVVQVVRVVHVERLVQGGRVVQVEGVVQVQVHYGCLR